MSDEDEKRRRDRRVEDHNYVPSMAPSFGQIGDFWSRYDRLADQTDKEMSKNLNGNLDVLLIFVSSVPGIGHQFALSLRPHRHRLFRLQAGLFSAVNTAFISLSIPSLSPTSSDETNNLLRLLVLRVDNGTLSLADLCRPSRRRQRPSLPIASYYLAYALVS